jgi:hypothetical protein
MERVAARKKKLNEKGGDGNLKGNGNKQVKN